MACGPWQAASLLQRSQAVAPFDFEDAKAPLGELSSEDWARLLLEGSGLLQNSTAAAVEGVKANKHGDLIIFLSSLATNLGTVIVVLTLLGLLRWAVPRVYGEGKSYFGWISASWSRSTDEVEEAAGLDHAMHLEFLDLSMRICLLVGLPCVLVLCPLHFFFGGGAAGQDRLSSIGMGNVVHGSWLCWVHAFMVWYVALIVHAQVHRAQKSFLPLRMRWLKEMPEPQVTSVLLQNIPEHLKTEEDLRSFFDDGVFGYRAVKEIYFGKDTRELLRWQKTAEDSAQGRAYQTGTGRVLKGDELKLVADSMTQRLRREILRSDDMNQSCAFVTFQRRREAAICYRLLSADDNDGLRADLPPEPSEVLWQDLCVSPERQAIFELLGYFLIFLVFWGFMPLVVFIQSIANLSTLENDIPFFKYLIEQLPALATLWNGLMASFALSVAMSMLPTLLMLIFTNCFVSKAEVNRQHRLQIWYNYFLVTYVLLVTAVGSSIFTTGRHLLQHPFDAPGLLAQNMPQSTHFYLNFIPMQMAAYATGGLRLPQASKYLAFRSCYDSEKAKEKCEPEDQDFMGMGSRSARAALQLSVVLTFCTLSPLISLLGWLCFVVCRTVHGFLFVEVEQRKADLGGVFWVTSLEQVQQGLFLFVLLMTGVLAERSGGVGPSAVAAGCWVFVAWSYVSFKRRHRWQHLEVEEILQEEERPQSRHSTSEHYGQPELPRSKSLVQAVRSKLGVC